MNRVESMDSFTSEPDDDVAAMDATGWRLFVDREIDEEAVGNVPNSSAMAGSEKGIAF